MAGLAAKAGTGLKRTGALCGIATLLASLDDEDRAVLLGWLNDPSEPSSAIARRLAAHCDGPVPNQDVFTRHRRGDCACDRAR